MSKFVTTLFPPATVEAEGDRAYVGYRWPGVAMLRLPSGDYARIAPRSQRALAATVLGDRLHQAPDTRLLEQFGSDWVAERAQGEFVWPTAAVDEWLTAHLTDVAAPPSHRRPPVVGSRARAFARHLFAAPLPRLGVTPLSRGGH